MVDMKTFLFLACMAVFSLATLTPLRLMPRRPPTMSRHRRVWRKSITTTTITTGIITKSRRLDFELSWSRAGGTEMKDQAADDRKVVRRFCFVARDQ